jgi:hemerythrin-like metal-binding protein
MALQWSASLSVGVVEIDNQHKKLIQMLNELNDGMRSGKGAAAIGPVLTHMIEYATTHFSFEEKLFDIHGYPGTASHKIEHNNFVKKVVDFKKQFDNGTAMLSIEVMNFLTDWLKNHIMRTDKSYTSFFNAKGVK